MILCDFKECYYNDDGYCETDIIEISDCGECNTFEKWEGEEVELNGQA